MGPIERVIMRLIGVRQGDEMDWKTYSLAVVLFNFIGGLGIYGLARVQGVLPLNPSHLGAVPPYLALNTAVSFVTNTNWQAYGGEATMSYLTQMAGLAVHNFLSAATGLGVLAALVRGLIRRETTALGNFWVDVVRSTLYILLPLSFCLALALVWQGVPQTFKPAIKASMLEQVSPARGGAVSRPAENTGELQVIPLGPVASQVAIKQLGTNGGGYYNVNSAHPLENPTPLSNFLEVLSILLIPTALCYTFGVMVGDRRQGWALLTVMLLIFLPMLALCVKAELSGNPLLDRIASGPVSVSRTAGNMEGKEVRFGVAASALWAVATTAASNGSVNSMHDSYTPLGGLVPMWLMQLGEVVFGGVGSGLYGLLSFVFVAVFAAGLMVGRTPEYLGKKIQGFEVKMASLAILIPPLLVLGGTAIAVSVPAGLGGIANPGAHGFSEVLYAFSSMANNNGSAFAGLNANSGFYYIVGSVVMWLSRFWLAVPMLAIAGSLAGKKTVPASAGTLPTHTILFILMLVFTVILVGALTFIPALALGPVVEHLKMAAAMSGPVR